MRYPCVGLKQEGLRRSSCVVEKEDNGCGNSMQVLFVKAAPSAVTGVTFDSEKRTRPVDSGRKDSDLRLNEAGALLVNRQGHSIVQVIRRADVVEGAHTVASVPLMQRLVKPPFFCGEVLCRGVVRSFVPPNCETKLLN